MPELSEQAYEDFFAWMAEQYGIQPTILQLPETLMRFGKNSEYYQYWQQYIYPQSASAQAGQPPPEPEEEPPQETPPFALPKTIKVGGKDIPVNYTIINQYDKTFLEEDENGDEVEVSRIVSVYAPVVPVEQLTPETLNIISQNIYEVDDKGQVQNENKPLTPVQLGNYFQYDPIKQTSDLTELRKFIANAAILEKAKTSGIDVTPELKKYVADIASRFPERGVATPDAIDQSLRAFDPFAAQKEEIMRSPEFALQRKQMGIDLDVQSQRLEAAQRTRAEKPSNLLTTLTSQGVDKQTALDYILQKTGGAVVQPMHRTPEEVFKEKHKGVTQQELDRQKRFKELSEKARLRTATPQRVGRI